MLLFLFFPFLFFFDSIHLPSIDRSSLFHRQGLDKDERDVTYIAIISPHRDAIESRLLLFRRSNPPLRSTSACGATSFAQVAKEGRYSSFEDSLTRGVTGDSKRERERERGREAEREREKRRGSRLKTNTLLRERGRAGGESPAVRFLRVTSRSRLNNTR